ncbi:MAG TPA: hypothetical protein V6D15_09420 [Oculatellaceae cyanobacterium]|jgi:ElaB/YqjD/DUF883 family membrane-anchored ribosome-binding protein
MDSSLVPQQRVRAQDFHGQDDYIDLEYRQVRYNSHEEAVRKAQQELHQAKQRLRRMERNIGPAIQSGSCAAIDVAGQFVHNSKPWRLGQVIGFWAMIVGLCTIGGWAWNAAVGGTAAAGNSAALPANAPTAMKFGHAVVNVGKPVAGAVFTGASQGIDRGVRVQLTGSAEPQRNVAVPTNVTPSSSTFVPVVPIANYAGQ